MAWTSKFAAKYTKPLVRQVVGILKRDIQAALDDVSGIAGSLAPFAEWDLATVPIQNFPALLIIPHDDRFDSETQEALRQTVRLSIAVAVTHQDPSTCAELVQDYVRAVDEVLNSAWWLTNSDFYLAGTLALPSPPFPAGATAPGLPTGTLEWLWIEGHAYDELRRIRSGLFSTSAVLSLIADLEET